jgi:hypothetical protein
MSVTAKVYRNEIPKKLEIPKGKIYGIEHNAKAWAVKVTCPYCSMGWADVVVTKKHDNLDADVREPRKCNWPSCRREFRLKWVFQLTAERFENVPGLVIRPEGA